VNRILNSPDLFETTMNRAACGFGLADGRRQIVKIIGFIQRWRMA
jgi:hypothetical protein